MRYVTGELTSRITDSLGNEVAETASAASTYFLGVDGGGSKTEAVITGSAGELLGEGTAGGSNPVRVGIEEAVSNIRTAVREACAQAGISVANIKAACVALAGINHPTFYAMKEALGRMLPVETLRIVSDAQAALAGALDGRAGVVVVAGTGSIAIGLNEQGEEARSGGWGPTLGDEGSGYDIARRALRAVVAAFDGRSPKTVLTERISDRLGISNTAELPGVIYSDTSNAEPVEIAPLAELVADAAREGDSVARSILTAAGRELGLLAASVIEKLRMQTASFRVAYVGSVFKASEFVLAPLREAVRAVAPNADVGPPVSSPAMGAVRLAQVSSKPG